MQSSLTLNQIRSNAAKFASDWKCATSESADKQTFWNEFFLVFGITRRRYAAFEVPVQLRDGRRGNIDLFWPGLLLVEHKSTGKDLTAAAKQAVGYFDGIAEKDLPKFIVVSDFARIRIYDLDSGTDETFSLAELPTKTSHFGFLTGYRARAFSTAPEVNVEASKRMAELHNELRRNGYSGQPLEVLMVRLMFCMFADRTGLFQISMFRDVIERRTRADGSDVGSLLDQVFVTLNQREEDRPKNLHEDFAAFPFVNGHLFAHRYEPPAFDAAAREMLLTCLAYDWSKVSPDIFGAMFQHVMDEEVGRRRQMGAHYTSEKNILKTLGPMLLDPLNEAVQKANSIRALEALRNRIANAKILDPACGCGNFLVIAFRELRKLEIEILKKLRRLRGTEDQPILDVEWAQGLKVSAMYGIEYDPFPCQVAETALYMMDHLTNIEAGLAFGDHYDSLPLASTPHIIKGNALRLDWEAVVPARELTAVVGNPPFIGKKGRKAEQVADLRVVFGNTPGTGELDYVAGWYAKALRYVQGTEVPVVFVSTNSITQGEQVCHLWPRLFDEGLRIHFAHRTFRWDNDAPGEASVYCVIIGWSLQEPTSLLLYDYEHPRAEPHVQVVGRINPYLVDFEDVFVTPRRTPICTAPPIVFGSMPNQATPKRKALVGRVSAADVERRTKDQLLLTTEERDVLLLAEPRAKNWIRPFIGADEFLNGEERWCLWLVDATPADLRAMPEVMRRVETVRENRAASPRQATRSLAETPWLFGERRQPTQDYLTIPLHSSEHRRFIPMAMSSPNVIASNACAMVLSDDVYVFGVLQSTMHMAWVRQVCGRIKSDFRYSNEIVYNNYPWPANPTAQKTETVREAARQVVVARNQFPGQSLADLYDDTVMPTELRQAHSRLDQAVDQCYRRTAFDSELDRLRFLFAQYAELKQANDAVLLDRQQPRRRRVRRQ